LEERAAPVDLFGWSQKMTRPLRAKIVAIRRTSALPFKICVTIIEPGGARTNFRFGGETVLSR
jgi:hypothetical protein